MQDIKTLVFGRTNNGKIQFFRYLFVGGSSTVVDLSVYAVCLYFGVYYLLAAFISYLFGLTWNYTTSILWVFQSKHKRSKEIILVIVVTLGGLLWTELLLWMFVEMFEMDAFLARFVVVWIVLFWSFGMRKLLIFK